MRFCTAELKRDVICADLVQRWPGAVILSASGIRRDESTKRKKAPIHKEQPKLYRKKLGTSGFDWNFLLEWTKEDVFAYCKHRGFKMHEAYEKYGSSRVSCAFCILGSLGDLKASSKCQANQDIYRTMVDLEIRSMFSFKQNLWLGDVNPDLLTEEQHKGLARAKEFAALRDELEAKIPKHLHYVKGWPTVMPTWSEAKELATTRRIICGLYKLTTIYDTTSAVLDRYKYLMAMKPRAT
jgi:hypothetical protein